jgi:hypothetical protein
MTVAARLLSLAILTAAASAQPRPAPPPPPELAALIATARLESPVVSWCRGRLRPGRADAFAIATGPATGGGRYLVIDSAATLVELARFVGTADLSCYTPAEARKLDRDIHDSGIIHGGIAPRWRTTVVCAFLDDTSAECWQYSPSDRKYLKVGAWLT